MVEMNLEKWAPMSPAKGPPLPKYFNIFWPWYTEEEELPPEEQPGGEQAADIRISNLVISPSEVTIGGAVSVSVTATNYNYISGSKKISLSVNNTISEQTVYLEGGGSTKVKFEVKPTNAGSYNVKIDGLSGSFTVKALLPWEMSLTGEKVVAYGGFYAPNLLIRVKNPNSVHVDHLIYVYWRRISVTSHGTYTDTFQADLLESKTKALVPPGKQSPYDIGLDPGGELTYEFTGRWRMIPDDGVLRYEWVWGQGVYGYWWVQDEKGNKSQEIKL